MDRDKLFDDFVDNSFRNIADQDYIAARLSYRHGLYPQFLWQSLQAIEKYLKAILLYNRIDVRSVNHNLNQALKLTKGLSFELELSEDTLKFIKHLSICGEDRYLTVPYFVRGPMLIHLDRTAWELRRYCRVFSCDNGTGNILQVELARIKQSDSTHPYKFHLAGGLLEKIIDDSKHLSRGALIWQNAFFGTACRPRVKVPTRRRMVNPPLYLYPEILDYVLNYVKISKNALKACQAMLNKK